MSNAISRRLRRARGLPAVAVSGEIVAPNNMFRVEDVRELRSFADVMMSGPDIPLPELLDDHVMLGQDVSALEHLDDYLHVVHTKFADRTDDESLRLLRNLVAYGGAYVGECLMQDVPDAIWLLPVDIERDHPRVMDLGPIDGQVTGVVYTPTADHYAFPFAKVFKFLINGRQDGTRYFVSVMADQMGAQ